MQDGADSADFVMKEANLGKNNDFSPGFRLNISKRLTELYALAVGISLSTFLIKP